MLSYTSRLISSIVAVFPFTAVFFFLLWFFFLRLCFYFWLYFCFTVVFSYLQLCFVMCSYVLLFAVVFSFCDCVWHFRTTIGVCWRYVSGRYVELNMQRERKCLHSCDRRNLDTHFSQWQSTVINDVTFYCTLSLLVINKAAIMLLFD